MLLARIARLNKKKLEIRQELEKGDGDLKLKVCDRTYDKIKSLLDMKV